MKRIVLWAGVIAALAGARPALSQTALERLESRLRQESGKAPAAAPGATPNGSVWLGVVADDERDRGRGVRVVEIAPDGPAAKAGFVLQDLITSVGGIRTRQMRELIDMLQMYKAGDSVAFEVVRGDKTQTLQVTFGESPAAKEPAVEEPAAKDMPAPAEPARKPEEPLLLAPSLGRAAPIIKPDTPGTEPGAIEALQQRLEKLEQRVADLERALEASKKEKPPVP